ncbi:MAG: hypothetical protein ABIW80_09325 [Lapillicoccus sp.]
MRSLVRRTWLAIAVIPLVVLATSHTAFASNGTAYAADHAAITYYFDSGDYVTVCDNDIDSHGAVGWIEVRQADGSYHAFPHLYEGDGYNHCTQVVQDVQRETATVKVVSCLQDGRYGRPWNCGFVYVSG